MVRDTTGRPTGRPTARRVKNCHGMGCECCGVTEATVWRCAPPDDGAPKEPLRPWRWYCSGTGSGGTRSCPNHANRAGAVTNDGSDPRTIFDVVGLSPSATAAEVKASYRVLALRWHPDKATAGDREDFEEKFKLLSSAYTAYKDSLNQGASACMMQYGVCVSLTATPHPPPPLLPTHCSLIRELLFQRCRLLWGIVGRERK